MLLGGETQVDTYNNPTSNGGNLNAVDDNAAPNINGNTNDANTSLDTSMSNVNMIQSSSAQQQQLQAMNDDYKAVSKDSNQNFLSESNLELFQPQHPQHVSPRVQPYDLNIAHQQAHLHNLRSSNNHMSHYSSSNNNNGVPSNGRSKLSPYKNQNLLVNNQNSMFDGIVSSSTNNGDMMVLKVEPENGY